MARPILNRYLLVRRVYRDSFDPLAAGLPVAPALWQYFRWRDAFAYDDNAGLAATGAARLDSVGSFSASLLFPRAAGWSSAGPGLLGALRSLHPAVDWPCRIRSGPLI